MGVPRATRRHDERERRQGSDVRRKMEELVELVHLAEDEEAVQVRRVQPSRATKPYICPGCQQEISPGTGHVVVVPAEMPELRRHWHTPCWLMRHRRRPGR